MLELYGEWRQVQQFKVEEQSFFDFSCTYEQYLANVNARNFSMSCRSGDNILVDNTINSNATMFLAYLYSIINLLFVKYICSSFPLSPNCLLLSIPVVKTYHMRRKIIMLFHCWLSSSRGSCVILLIKPNRRY